MDTPDPTEVPARREEIARQLGLAPDRVTDAVIEQIADDPLFLHHLELCRDSPEMLDLLLGTSKDTPDGRPATAPPVAPSHRPLPGNAELLGRASAALGRWAASGFGRVTHEEYRARLSTCEGCEHLAVPPRKGFYRLMGDTEEKSVCGLCGCDVRRKAWLATEECPDGRWKAATG
jgi:hypothetical protein